MKTSILMAVAVMLALFSETIQAQVSEWNIPPDHKIFQYAEANGHKVAIEVVAPNGQTYFFVGFPGEMAEIRGLGEKAITPASALPLRISLDVQGFLRLNRLPDRSFLSLQASHGLPGYWTFVNGQQLGSSDVGNLMLPEPGTSLVNARMLCRTIKAPRLLVNEHVDVYVAENARVYRVTNSNLWNQFYYQAPGSETLQAIEVVNTPKDGSFGPRFYLTNYLTNIESQKLVEFEVRLEGIAAKHLGTAKPETVFVYQKGLAPWEFNEMRMMFFGPNRTIIPMSEVEVFDERLKRLKNPGAYVAKDIREPRTDTQVFSDMATVQRPIPEAQGQMRTEKTKEVRIPRVKAGR